MRRRFVPIRDLTQTEYLAEKARREGGPNCYKCERATMVFNCYVCDANKTWPQCFGVEGGYLRKQDES